MATLIGCNLELDRAKHHLDTLQEQVRLFTDDPETYRITAYDDLEAGQYVLTIDFDGPPTMLGPIAGDFIGCTRSALDHLAWQLATLTTPIPSDKISFPVLEKSPYTDHGANGTLVKVTQGIPAAAVTVMKSLQPYNSGNAYKLTHLWRLNKLWNIDKHRHIILHSGVANIRFPGLPPDLEFMPKTTAVDDRAEVRLPLAAKNYMKFNPAISIQVFFGNTAEGIELTTQDLYEYVREKVIPRFAGFFT